MGKPNNGAAGRMAAFGLVVIGLAVVLAIILFYAQTASAQVRVQAGMAPFVGPSCLTVPPGISLCSDGTVTVPAGMKMDAAARQFVDELRAYWPTVCGGKKP